MYNVPVYRIRAYMRSLRRSRPATPKKEATAIHLRKAAAELRVLDGYAYPTESASGVVVLNELTAKGVSLYSESRFHPGQQIALTIEEPRRFYVRGRVISAEHIGARLAVISEHPLPFRLVVAFEYNGVEDLMAVKQYCDELANDLLYPVAPVRPRRERGRA